MGKTIFRMAVIALLVINLSGCAELKRKFTRKTEPKRDEYSFYKAEPYTPPPAEERYQEHYILWHNWHLDLLRREVISHKKQLMAINEVLRHLTSMRDLLTKEKAQELDEQIVQLRLVANTLKEKRIVVFEDVHSRKIVEKVERVVINNFSYNRMRDHIRQRIIELQVLGEEKEG